MGVGLLFGLVGIPGAVRALTYVLLCFALTTGSVLWEHGVASGGTGDWRRGWRRERTSIGRTPLLHVLFVVLVGQTRTVFRVWRVVASL